MSPYSTSPSRRSWRHAVLLLAPLAASFLSTAEASPAAVAASVAAPLPEETLFLDSRVLSKQHGEWVFLAGGRSDPVLRRRDDDSSDVSTSTTKTKTAKAATTETTEAATTTKEKTTSTKDSTETATRTSTTKTSTTTASASPLPSIFDSNLGNNFTDSSCPSFIKTVLKNETFKACYPFSMLIQGSRSFFEAEKSLVSITQVLDATCAANVTTCTSYLTALAANLTDAANCGADHALGNPIVAEAYAGMRAYNVLYTATCLTDPATSQYCYANAITNATTPANVYFYYLPLNISLPASTQPSCNACLQNTMAVFRTAAADRQQAIASTYAAAAQQVDSSALCGPGFVDATLPAAAASSGSWRQGASLSWLVAAVCLGLAQVLLL